MQHSKYHASDFPNYNVSEDGIITNSKGKIIKGEISNTGYRRVSLSNNNAKHKKMSVHRLVAETYIPNPHNYPEVNHKNENKLDNLNHSHVIEKASVAKYRKVKCITTGKIYNSIKEAADELGLYHSNIVACCNGRRATCGGLEWEYL